MKQVRKIPIDFKSISEQTGCTKGRICKTSFGWGVIGNGDSNICLIDPPETNGKETIRIEDNHWVIERKD